jgi:hypothetical protein
MMGRRLVAMLCVLLAHAWAIYELSKLDSAAPVLPGVFETSPITLPITFFDDELPLPPEPDLTPPPLSTTPRMPDLPQASVVEGAAAESSAITDTSKVDWPLEGKKAAARVLAREAEAERIAKMFAGPGGTWASLTKRQRSTLNKFRWKPGVKLEYDSQGNQIYHLGDGCMIVNSGFIACKIGKVKPRGDMFENMREYFDEMRLPETDEGNGTEPEALRPPY